MGETWGTTVFEPTIVTMPLPHGRDYLWYADLNVVALAPHLDTAGRERALYQLTVEWRTATARRLTAVPTQHTRPAPTPATMPVPASAV